MSPGESVALVGFVFTACTIGFILVGMTLGKIRGELAAGLLALMVGMLIGVADDLALPWIFLTAQFSFLLLAGWVFWMIRKTRKQHE